MSATVIRNARLLDPASGRDGTGSILVIDGVIAALDGGDGAPSGATMIDCRGHCLAPGIVDMRVQLREPGAEHMENMVSASHAAAAGGITTMAALPNTEPPIDDVALVDFVARRARDIGLVNIEAGALAFTDGLRAIADALVMRRALSYARTFDLLIIQHPEEPNLAAGGAMTEGEMATRLGLPGITPAAEVMMVERDLRLVEITGARYHAAHVSTAAAIEAIRAAKQRGLPVTCDTAPPYFALNETAVGEYRTFAKLSPPLRGEWDRRAVVEGLRDGTIDAIASDHAPHDQDSKRLPFTSAESGIIGLETLLPLSLELYHNGHLPLISLLRALTCAPADILRLPAGRLVVGAPADFVVFDLDRPWQIAEEDFRSKSKNSPFDGRPVQGRAIKTIVGGRVVYDSKD